MKRATASAMVFALLLAAGAFLSFAAPAYAQVNPCTVKANYGVNKNAAESAQRELNMRERALPEAVKRRLARTNSSVDVDGVFGALEKEKPSEKIAAEAIASYQNLIALTDESGDREPYSSKEDQDRRRDRKSELNRAIKAIEAWLLARKQRDQADERVRQATLDYPLVDRPNRARTRRWRMPRRRSIESRLSSNAPGPD